MDGGMGREDGGLTVEGRAFSRRADWACHSSLLVKLGIVAGSLCVFGCWYRGVEVVLDGGRLRWWKPELRRVEGEGAAEFVCGVDP